MRVGVLGAGSIVAAALVPMLRVRGDDVTAYSRSGTPLPEALAPGEAPIESWISTLPLWVLPGELDRIARLGAKHVIAVGSTSRYTKSDSSSAEEREVAMRLARAEDDLIAWCARSGVAYTLLRATLIYGNGLDRNITEIARFIRRFGFFPIFGRAEGRRQPIHLEDVAQACIAALDAPAARNRGYDISGGEVLAYREMVARVFSALGRSPRFVKVPMTAFRLGVAMLRVVPRFRSWTPAMAARMNEDLVFDHADATRDLGLRPRPFRLRHSDLPGR